MSKNKSAELCCFGKLILFYAYICLIEFFSACVYKISSSSHFFHSINKYIISATHTYRLFLCYYTTTNKFAEQPKKTEIYLKKRSIDLSTTREFIKFQVCFFLIFDWFSLLVLVFLTCLLFFCCKRLNFSLSK